MYITVIKGKQSYVGSFSESELQFTHVALFIRQLGTFQVPSNVLARAIETNSPYLFPANMPKFITVRAKVNKTSHHNFMIMVHITLECSVTSFE